MIEIIRTLFKPVSTYTLGAYRGKHILENKIGRYVSEDEFIKIMTDLGYKMNSKNQFKIAECPTFRKSKKQNDIIKGGFTGTIGSNSYPPDI